MLKYFTYNGNQYYVKKNTSNNFSWTLDAVIPVASTNPIHTSLGVDTQIVAPYDELQEIIISAYDIITDLNFVQILENLVRLTVKRNPRISAIAFHPNALTLTASNVAKDIGGKHQFKHLEINGGLISSIPICRTLVNLILINTTSLTSLSTGTNNTTGLSYPALQNLYIENAPISSLPANMNTDGLNSLNLIDTNISQISIPVDFCRLVPKTTSITYDVAYNNIGFLLLDSEYIINNASQAGVSDFATITTAGIDGYANTHNIIVI